MAHTNPIKVGTHVAYEIHCFGSLNILRIMPTHHVLFFHRKVDGAPKYSSFGRMFATTIYTWQKALCLVEFCLLFRYTKINKEPSRRKSCTNVIHFTSTSINKLAHTKHLVHVLFLNHGIYSFLFVSFFWLTVWEHDWPLHSWVRFTLHTHVARI